MIKPLQYQSSVASGTVARVEPNIKWFGEYYLLLLLYKMCAVWRRVDIQVSGRQEFWGEWNCQGLDEKGNKKSRGGRFHK